MPKEVNRTIELMSAFEFGEKELTELDQILSAVAPCEVELETKDSSTLTYASLREALAFPNGTEREVKTVQFKGNANGRYVRAKLHAGKRASENVYVMLSGEDEAMYLLSQNLRAWFKEQRPRWAFVAEHQSGVEMTVSVVTSLVAYPFTIPLVKWMSGSDQSVKFLLSVMFGIGCGIFGMLVGAALRAGTQRLFSPGTFTFGHGKKRSESLSSLRSVILGTVFGSILLGFIVNVAAGIFTAPLLAPSTSVAATPDAGTPVTDAGTAADDAGH